MMSKDQFVSVFGGVYEHSPFVAETVFEVGFGANSNEELVATMKEVVDSLGFEDKVRLLRAHPDLAGKLAVGEELTQSSKGEQASAGLDQCSQEEYHDFQGLNKVYLERFGFPFILAVSGWSRADILERFKERVNNDVELEFNTALAEVHKIAKIRMEQIFKEQG
jgi:2-oxo-4-hydroxy-4-carboxy-5-ureidoimidazoline decarboxylase